MENPPNPHDSIGVVNESVPSSEGPLVGGKLSTKLVHEAYAGADPPDPTFTAKTANLLHTCPSFRSVRGDGSCGFRAMMFSYFETLISLAEKDPAVLSNERKRVDAMTEMLHRSSYDDMTWEDWVDVTLELFDDVIAALPRGTAVETLEQAFNNDGLAPALVQHFRMLVSCYMDEHASKYADFMPDGLTVEQYRQAHIDPASAEMEEMSLKCAYDLLLDGAGLVLEIAYLDRSPGEKVNTHLYEPQQEEGTVPKGKNGRPAIKLLYRPGHYDILYAAPKAAKEEPPAEQDE